MNDKSEFKKRMRRNLDGKSHIWLGAFVLLVGVAALVKSFVIDLDWLFSWQMLLIVIGIFVGFRSKFQGGAWLAFILGGTYFLLDHFFVLDQTWRKMFWPIGLIGVGVFLMLRPKRTGSFCTTRMDDNDQIVPPAKDSINQPFTAEPLQGPAFEPAGPAILPTQEVLDVAAVFGAVKKNIYSKNFRGGEIVSVFGGAEINLSQANFITPQIEIESVQIFGGAKLIIPSDWTIHNEAVAIFGGIEDKRPQPVAIPVPEKVLVLKGFVMFGGIEIKSY